MIDLPATSFVLPIILLCSLCILALIGLVLKDVLREQGRSWLSTVLGAENRVAANDPRIGQAGQRHRRIRGLRRAAAAACEKSPLQMR